MGTSLMPSGYGVAANYSYKRLCPSQRAFESQSAGRVHLELLKVLSNAS
jgi:hypothetical protein